MMKFTSKTIQAIHIEFYKKKHTSYFFEFTAISGEFDDLSYATALQKKPILLS